MAENGFFATAFRGFKKEDVLTYIDSLNAEHFEELSALQQEVATLKEENEKLSADVPAMKAELETLRVQAAKAEALRTALEQAEQRAVALEDEKRTLENKVAELEPRAAEATRLTNENAVQAEQLASQQQQLAHFEAMFGKSKDTAAFMRENLTARMQENRAKTDKVLAAAERTTEKLAEELDAMRARLAAARAEADATAASDVETLDTWLSQFDNAAPSGTDGHFFR